MKKMWIIAALAASAGALPAVAEAATAFHSGARAIGTITDSGHVKVTVEG